MRISDWSSDVCSSDLGRDLFKKSLGIIGLFGANRGELVYAGLMFEELRDALESLEVAPGGDALVELHRLHGILDAKTAAAVAAFDSSGEWASDGSVSMSAWMRVRLRMSHGDASQLLKPSRLARSLRLRSDERRAGREDGRMCRHR